MKLEPGYYKIRKTYYGKLKMRQTNSNEILLLKVVGRNADTTYFIGSDTLGRKASEWPEFKDQYEIISKYDKEPIIADGYITLKFKDSAGDVITFNMRDTWAFRNLFFHLPFLAKPFQFLPKKK
jgi:hypothetical protein